MQVVKNYLYNAIYQVFILLVPLITIPYLARTLGPVGVGINSYTNSIIQYFILFGSIGVSLYGNRQIAFVRDDREKMSRTFFEILLMRIITISCAFIFFLVFMCFVKEYRSYYWAQSVSILAAAFDISWFFMGIEDFAITVLRNLFVKILTLVCIFTFVKSYNDLDSYILILSLSLLIGNLTLFPSLRKYVTLPNLKSIHPWCHLRPSLLLFIPQMATQIYLIVNKTMLGSMTSVRAAGYFDQSDKIIKMVLAVVTATGMVMLPHVANAFMNGKLDKTKEYLYRSFSFVTALSIPMLFGLIAVAHKFVPLFFTNKFSMVAPLMMLESVVVLFVSWGSAVGNQYLLPTKQMKSYTTSVILGAIVNVFSNIPLIHLWGATGATIATIASEMTVSGFQILSIKRQIKYHLLFEDFGKYLLSGILMFGVVVVVDYSTPVSWFCLIGEVSLGIVVYVFSLWAFKTKILEQACQLFINRR
ncbi:polysaccharide biosynthesis C-terminal domain-containing protein [Levilactobacillus brevis]|uniref:oligosaccharide flippase family protein n=1 Tax=Levilactobacillus brevis TaxID=1580 RepID=UPI002074598D|nr:polysaccharide biosynthesis C-terminal domain-containing protein [Levilactobacillus brevis]